jgi:flagellar hook-basal body complex protein FliE
MSTIDVNNLLSQMRQMTAQVRPAETAFKAAPVGGQAGLGQAGLELAAEA